MFISYPSQGVDIHFILALTTANVVMFFVLSLII